MHPGQIVVQALFPAKRPNLLGGLAIRERTAKFNVLVWSEKRDKRTEMGVSL